MMGNYLRTGVFLFIIVCSAVAAADDSSGGVSMLTASSKSYLQPDPAYEIVSETIRIVTAYNVGDPKQTWGDPCISANGENICKALKLGLKRCAANFVPLGTELLIGRYGRYVVTDRTNSRYRNRVDIAMHLNEYKKAKQFGKKKLNVKILKKIQVSARLWPQNRSHSPVGNYARPPGNPCSPSPILALDY
jgi:3D (Asp-Asp-Asp) domain-containing protein